MLQFLSSQILVLQLYKWISSHTYVAQTMCFTNIKFINTHDSSEAEIIIILIVHKKELRGREFKQPAVKNATCQDRESEVHE